MTIVIDASLALAWCFKDELTPQARQLLLRLQHETAHAPGLWPLEVTNALCVAERRGRITAAETSELASFLGTLDVVLDHEASALAFKRILELARSHQLTTYDAAYLELAMRLGVPLASKDEALCIAAERVGVTALRAT